MRAIRVLLLTIYVVWPFYEKIMFFVKTFSVHIFWWTLLNTRWIGIGSKPHEIPFGKMFFFLQKIIAKVKKGLLPSNNATKEASAISEIFSLFKIHICFGTGMKKYMFQIKHIVSCQFKMKHIFLINSSSRTEKKKHYCL